MKRNGRLADRLIFADVKTEESIIGSLVMGIVRCVERAMDRDDIRNALIPGREFVGEVDLRHGEFADADFAAVVRELPSMPQLRKLWLNFTPVGDIGVEALAEAAKQQCFPQLQTLSLYGTRVSDVGAGALASAGTQHGFPQLQTLSLDCTQVGDSGVLALADAAKHGFPQLQTLCLDHCPVGDTGIRALAEAAGHHGFRQLQSLSLHGTRVSSVLPAVRDTKDAKEIFRAILTGRALHQVRIALVGMGVGKTWLFSRLFLDRTVDLREAYSNRGR